MTREEMWAIANEDERVAKVLKITEDICPGVFLVNTQRLILAQEIVIKCLNTYTGERNEVRAECQESNITAVLA